MLRYGFVQIMSEGITHKTGSKKNNKKNLVQIIVVHCCQFMCPCSLGLRKKNLSWSYIATNKFLFQTLTLVFSIEQFKLKKKCSRWDIHLKGASDKNILYTQNMRKIPVRTNSIMDFVMLHYFQHDIFICFCTEDITQCYQEVLWPVSEGKGNSGSH